MGGGAETRRFLLNTGQSLSRDELDRSVDGDAVWHIAIAPKFNDPSLMAVLDLSGKEDATLVGRIKINADFRINVFV